MENGKWKAPEAGSSSRVAMSLKEREQHKRRGKMESAGGGLIEPG